MKNGPVYSDRKYRWFERNWPLLGDKYFTHAWGTLYVLSGRIAAQIGSIPDGTLRFFSNEGTTIFALNKPNLSPSAYLPSVCHFETMHRSQPQAKVPTKDTQGLISLRVLCRGVGEAIRRGCDILYALADVTIGSWLLALNSTHFDDRRLCETSCTGTSVGIYDFPKCAGLCSPVERLRELHADPACQKLAETELVKLPGFFDFPQN